MIEEFTFGVRPWVQRGRVGVAAGAISELFWIEPAPDMPYDTGWILGVNPMDNPLKCWFREARFLLDHQVLEHYPETYLGGVDGTLSEDWRLVKFHGVSMPDQDPMMAPMHYVVVLQHMLPRMRELTAAAWQGLPREQRQWMMRCRKAGLGHRLGSEACRRMLPARRRR